MSSLHIPPYGGPREGAADNWDFFRGGYLNSDVAEHPEGWGEEAGREKKADATGARASLREAFQDRGNPVTRQLSRSYFVPSSLEAYEQQLRQVQCEGYLKRRSRTTDTWRRRWFLLKDGYLSYFRDQEEAEAHRSDKDSQMRHHPSSQRQLAMETVEAVRTEESIGPLAFRVIVSNREDVVLRAESREAMTEWRWGFFCSQQSIIARYMDSGGEVWAADGKDSKGVLHGEGGLGRVAGDRRDPCRANADARKSSGCGWGRAARRLPLRQYQLGHSFNGPKCQGPRAAPNGGSSVLGGSGGVRNASGGVGVGGGGAKANGDTNGDTAGSSRPPKPSPRRIERGKLTRAERRRRAESMGSFGCTLGLRGGEGAWRGAGAGSAGGATPAPVAMAPIAAPMAAKPFMYRALSDGAKQGSQRAMATPGWRGAGAGLLNVQREGDGADGRHCGYPPRGSPAVEAAAAAVYGSSGDEDGPEMGSASESDRGSMTTSNEDGPKESERVVVTPHVSARSKANEEIRAQGPAKKEDFAKYRPPHQRGVTGGGGVGKYIPPAMRAANRDHGTDPVAGSVPTKLQGELSMRGGGGGRTGDGEQEKLEGNDLGEEALSPQFNVSEDEPEDDDVDDVLFGGLETDESPPRHPSEGNGGGGGSPSSLTAPRAGPTVSSDVAKGRAGGEEASDDGVLRAMLPNGQALPWAPVTRDHYYTGGYHSRRPCTPGGACNARGGGSGGGRDPTPFEPKDNPTMYYTFLNGDRTAVSEHRRQRVFDQRDEGGMLGDRGGHDGASPAHGEGGGVARPPLGGWEGSEVPASEGLWWSCGASSLIGRRAKQEDRYCVMPDYRKCLMSAAGRKKPEGHTMSTPADVDDAEPCSPVGMAVPSAMDDGGAESLAKADGDGAGKAGPPEDSLALGFFGVYDGHCGSEAVQFVRDRLHCMVGEHEDFGESPDRAIRDSFVAADKQFLSLALEKEWFSGTTVLVALLRGRRLLVGNIGDGEAVLARGKEEVEMSVVHHPGRPDESQRIADANGWVTTEQELFLRQLKQMDLNDPEIRMSASEHVRWTTITRVCGELAVSRSIGDRDFKGFTKRRLEEGTDAVVPLEMSLFAWPKGHSGKFRDDLLTAEPEFSSTLVGPGDEFLIMASDGVWDVLTKQQAVEHARKLFDEGLCAQAVAERVCELAYRMGTSDNITAVIVKFQHESPDAAAD